MKNLKIAAIFLLIISSGIAHSQKKKVAVIAFYADKVIDLSEVDASADFIAKNTALSDNPDFNLSNPLNKFHEAFFNNYVNEFDFELVPEEKVLELPEYKKFKAEYGDYKNIGGQEAFETIDGYKVIQSYGERLEVKNIKPIAEALGVDAIMFVRLNYRFNKTGIGKLGYFSIQAVVSLSLYSKNNKSIFQFSELAGSKKKAAMVGGLPVMTPKKIQPMCDSATDELIKDMNKKIDRLSKKANKKLN
ncbi:hypothetical protein [uncultured Winogradskyella sp.]|uniref:hypothetical protein n=1 Tax=uncultured Winogradskyella sp. TaxID=395353 RepID=UPI0026262EA2|nr:hypothetical protein [uncultured Winogradskyella sp.]